MKIESRNTMAVVIFSVVIIIAALASFFFLGSGIALLFAMVGVPVIFIALILSLLLRVRGPGEESKLKKRELDSTAKKLLEVRNKVSEIAKEFNVDTEKAELQLQSVEETLQRQGCMFSGDTIKYDDAKVGKTKLAEISDVEKEITSLTQSVADVLYKAVLEKISWYVEELEKLNACGYEVGTAISSLNSLSTGGVRSDLLALRGLASDATEELKHALESCFTGVRESVQFASGFYSVAEEEGDLELAEEKLRNEDYGTCVSLLEKVMTGIDEKLSSNFREYENELLRCFNDVLQVMAEEDSADIKRLKEVVEGVTAPSQMKLLVDAFNNLVRALSEVLDRILGEYYDLTGRMHKENVPEWFLEAQSAPEIGELPGDVTKLPAVFTDIYSKLKTIVNTLRDKSRVSNAYSRVEGMITKKLGERGGVSSDELKMKHAELFMRLYAAKHPEVTYDETKQQLSGGEFVPPEGEERSEVILTIRDAESKEPLEAKVIVGKKEHKVSGGELRLELPHKRYAFKILADGYESKDMQVDVEGDTALEPVELKERVKPLDELLCGDMEDRIKAQIQKLGPYIERFLEEHGSITSNDNVGFRKKEYMPCLLYLWAYERENVKFVKNAGKYIIYDMNTVIEKLIDALNRYEIDDDMGDSYELYEIANDADLSLPIEELQILMKTVKDKRELNYIIEVSGNIVRLIRGR